jgi:hypothetical protein
MSVTGILANSLLNFMPHGAQKKVSDFQQDLQKLGADLSSGNLAGAQSDLATLQQLTPRLSASSQSNSNIATAFNKLANDLQTGNLAAAQQDYATLQQNSTNAHAHRHHMHAGSANASTTISQIFSQLGQALQSGNLSAAQQAYTTLQQDFAQFMAGGAAGTAASAISSGLSVTA